jgi:hypothetical protein
VVLNQLGSGAEFHHEKLGSCLELIQYHNVWVLSQVEETDPYTFEKWKSY